MSLCEARDCHECEPVRGCVSELSLTDTAQLHVVVHMVVHACAS